VAAPLKIVLLSAEKKAENALLGQTTAHKTAAIQNSREKTNSRTENYKAS
jgi:hypothetical protein